MRRVARWAVVAGAGLLLASGAAGCFYSLDGSLVDKPRDGAVEALALDLEGAEGVAVDLGVQPDVGSTPDVVGMD